ncbi:1-acyl-sn-glycerol-3-phosphate acyltransferase [Nocardioidaceae bacterium]|nr:1-acyl-sn-glycerol-3-phosphate acyltransferase [Nocardioidaceae bacterium]
MLDITYPVIIVSAKTAFRLMDFRFDMTGTEHVPESGGALMAFNHISYIDYVFGGYAAQPSNRLIRFMAKKEIFDHPVGGPLMRSFHHIPVDRADGQQSFDDAVDYLRRGEIVGIFPEATISRSFEVKDIKTGATRIAAEAGVPLLPSIIWGTHRIFTKDHDRDLARGKTIIIDVGEPMYPTGEDVEAETAELHRRMKQLHHDAVSRYPAEEQPPGSWWLPQSFGGSAPTLEEAAAMDVEEKRRRAERKAARDT